MAKFYVDDSNNAITGPYATLDEALEDANESLSFYRKSARTDGWDLGEGDLCIYEVADDFNEDEAEPNEGKLIAKVVEFDKQQMPEGEGYEFDYTCDMRMGLV